VSAPPPGGSTAADRLEVVGELASLINTTFDLNEIFRSAIVKLRRVLPFRRASVTLLSEDGEHYQIHTLYDGARGGFQVVEQRFALDYGLPGQVIRTGEAIRVDEFGGTEGIRQVGEGAISALILPLKVDGAVIGSLNLGAEESLRYGDEDLELAQLLGRQIETSLHYSKLLSTIERQREELAVEHGRARLQQIRLEALIEAGESAIMMVAGGVVVHANRAMAELLGLPIEVVLDAPLDNVHRALARSFRDPADFAPQVAALRPGSAPLRDQVDLVFPQPRTFQRAVDPVLSRYGEPMGHLVVYRDVTRAAETDAAKDEFVSMVSHELRTPLSSVKTSLVLLNRGAAGQVTDAMAEFITIALRNIERLIKLVDDLLDLSRIESGRLVTKVAPTRVSDVAAHAIEMVRAFADDQGIILECNVHAPCRPVLVDPARLEQVFVNLLSNAIKFSPQRGRVALRWTEDAGAVVTEIADEGPGIPEGQLRAVFDKFRQLEPAATRGHGGVGLGLYISRAILEQLGGELWAESEGGRGTRFYVKLPLATEAPATVAPPPEVRPAAAGVRRLLLVTPDPDFALLIRTRFEQDGISVAVTSGGWAALGVIAREPPDVVVVHAQLEDMHGLEFMQRLRARPEVADLPAILVGGDPTPARATSYGADAWVADDADSIADEVRRRGAAPRRPVVLFIEDDPAVRGALARLIRLQGYAVVEASHGTLGLELARRRVPDAVLIDYNLPGMSGLDILRAMRDDPELAAVPGLLLSGHAAPQVVRDAAALGAGFLPKPMDWTVIVQTVARLITDPSAPVGAAVPLGDQPSEELRT
jgi:signal transduction histidine kinase/DNA-binding response OmpR family regulator